MCSHLPPCLPPPILLPSYSAYSSYYPLPPLSSSSFFSSSSSSFPPAIFFDSLPPPPLLLPESLIRPLLSSFFLLLLLLLPCFNFLSFLICFNYYCGRFPPPLHLTHPPAPSTANTTTNTASICSSIPFPPFNRFIVGHIPPSPLPPLQIHQRHLLLHATALPLRTRGPEI